MDGFERRPMRGGTDPGSARVQRAQINTKQMSVPQKPVLDQEVTVCVRAIYF